MLERHFGAAVSEEKRRYWESRKKVGETRRTPTPFKSLPETACDGRTFVRTVRLLRKTAERLPPKAIIA